MSSIPPSFVLGPPIRFMHGKALLGPQFAPSLSSPLTA
jgi:hypothetical protein